MRKPAFCICENKDADQLRGNHEADQRLCFRYFDSTIPLLPKSEILSFLTCSVAVQPGLCLTWSETPKTGFLTTRLIFSDDSLKELGSHSTNPIIINEPRCEKTGLRGYRPGPTQTRLHDHTRWLEA